jgi:anti-sigma regulatory factor (Ser/Thr protein kinase)
MRAQATFPPAPASTTAARRFVVERLREWGAESLADDAAVLVSELVSNVVAHAGTDAQVEAILDDGRLHVVVSDGSASLPEPTAPIPLGGPPEALHGRGLRILGALADSWAIEPTSDGKRVWFELGDLGPHPG